MKKITVIIGVLLVAFNMLVIFGASVAGTVTITPNLETEPQSVYETFVVSFSVANSGTTSVTCGSGKLVYPSEVLPLNSPKYDFDNDSHIADWPEFTVGALDAVSKTFLFKISPGMILSDRQEIVFDTGFEVEVGSDKISSGSFTMTALRPVISIEPNPSLPETLEIGAVDTISIKISNNGSLKVDSCDFIWETSGIEGANLEYLPAPLDANIISDLSDSVGVKIAMQLPATPEQNELTLNFLLSYKLSSNLSIVNFNPDLMQLQYGKPGGYYYPASQSGFNSISIQDHGLEVKNLIYLSSIYAGQKGTLSFQLKNSQPKVLQDFMLNISLSGNNKVMELFDDNNEAVDHLEIPVASELMPGMFSEVISIPFEILYSASDQTKVGIFNDNGDANIVLKYTDEIGLGMTLSSTEDFAIKNFNLDLSSGAVGNNPEYGHEVEFKISLYNTGSLEGRIDVVAAPALGTLKRPRCISGFKDVCVEPNSDGTFIWHDLALAIGDSAKATIGYVASRGDEVGVDVACFAPNSGAVITNFTIIANPSGQAELAVGLFPSPYRGEGDAYIKYWLDDKAKSVSYRIFDLTGIEVASSSGELTDPDQISAGEAKIKWDGFGRGGTMLPNGVYFLELTVMNEDETTNKLYQKIAILVD